MRSEPRVALAHSCLAVLLFCASACGGSPRLRLDFGAFACPTFAPSERLVWYDEAGKVIATAAISTPVEQPTGGRTFNATSNVSRARFYRHRIRGHEGPIYSYDELDRHHWEVAEPWL